MRVMIVVLVVATTLPARRTSAWPRTLPEVETGREGERRLCGWRLANELNRVCRGVYNKPTVSTNNALFYMRERGGKRADLWMVRVERGVPPRSNMQVGELRADLTSEPRQAHTRAELGQRLPFLSGAKASQVIEGSLRTKRGLSAECCRKACSVSELAGYCY